MYVPSTFAEAIICCLITMVCWGSWAKIENLAIEKWRFELFYWDHAIGILLATIVLGFTWGSVGNVGRSFFDDLAQSKVDYFVLAFSSGILFNFSNVLIVNAIASVGIQIALPVTVVAGLVVGVLSNYITSPKGHPALVFAGVILIVYAIWLDAQAFKYVRPQRTRPSLSKLVLPVASGALFGLFYCVLAMATAHHYNPPEIGKLGPYGSVFSFAVGVFLSALLFIPSLMEEPISGQPLTIDDYLNASLRDHLVGVLSGSIWCFGLELSVLAAERMGFGVSFGISEGAMLISALWSIYFWDEFRDAPKETNFLLISMVVAYVLGLLSFVLASVFA